MKKAQCKQAKMQEEKAKDNKLAALGLPYGDASPLHIKYQKGPDSPDLPQRMGGYLIPQELKQEHQSGAPSIFTRMEGDPILKKDDEMGPRIN